MQSFWADSKVDVISQLSKTNPFFMHLQSNGFPGGIVSQLTCTSRLDNATSLYRFLQQDPEKISWLDCKFKFHGKLIPPQSNDEFF